MPAGARPSSVVTGRSPTSPAARTHERTGSPPTSTVHAPQTPSPQPGFAAVSPSCSTENRQQRLLWPDGHVVFDSVYDQPHRPAHAGRRAKKTSSRPGRSGAPRTSSTTYPASASAAQTSSRSRKRSVESDVSHFAVGEHARPAEADQRQGHFGQLDPALDCAHAVHLRNAVRRGPRPLAPRFGCRVSGLEYQAPVGPQGVVDTTQRSFPVSRLDNRLGNVAGHGREFQLQRRQRRCVAMDPAHALCSGLGARDIERRTRRIDTDHVQAPAGQKQRECARPTADIEDTASRELVGDGSVDIEVAAVGVQRVVDRRQPWMLEDVVSHAT